MVYEKADDALWETMEKGDVVVNSTLGHTEWGHYGDIVCMLFKAKGAAGLVTDGVLRDAPPIRDTKWPVFTLGGRSNPAGRTSRATSIEIIPRYPDSVIRCDGCTVRPGDIIVGDGEAVLVIPIEIAEKVARMGLATEKIEEMCREKALQGVFSHPIEWEYIVEAGLTEEAEISGYKAFLERKAKTSKTGA